MQEDYDLATGLIEDAAAEREQRPKQHASEQRLNRKQSTKKAKKAAKRRAKG